jgi:uncharacterized membrane protein YgcG
LISLVVSLLFAAAPAGGWVEDGAELLTPDEVRELNTYSDRLLTDRGVRLGVLTVKVSLGETPKEIAVRTLNAWNPGPRSALLLVSMNPRELYLQPGTALAPTFDERTATDICRNTIGPALRAGRSKEALLAGFTRIASILDRPAIPPPPIATRPQPPLFDFMGLACLALPVGLVVLVVVLVLNSGQKCPRCRKKMIRQRTVIQQATYVAAGIAEDVFSCACGHSFRRSVNLAALSSASGIDSTSGFSGFDNSGGGGGGGGGSSSDGSGGGGSSF